VVSFVAVAVRVVVRACLGAHVLVAFLMMSPASLLQDEAEHTLTLLQSRDSPSHRPWCSPPPASSFAILSATSSSSFLLWYVMLQFDL
jgi:hypothetical protein